MPFSFPSSFFLRFSYSAPKSLSPDPVLQNPYVPTKRSSPLWFPHHYPIPGGRSTRRLPFVLRFVARGDRFRVFSPLEGVKLRPRRARPSQLSADPTGFLPDRYLAATSRVKNLVFWCQPLERRGFSSAKLVSKRRPAVIASSKKWSTALRHHLRIVDSAASIILPVRRKSFWSIFQMDLGDILWRQSLPALPLGIIRKEINLLYTSLWFLLFLFKNQAYFFILAFNQFAVHFYCENFVILRIIIIIFLILDQREE